MSVQWKKGTSGPGDLGKIKDLLVKLRSELEKEQVRIVNQMEQTVEIAKLVAEKNEREKKENG